MLKTRVLPTLLLKDLGLVKGVGFDPWRRTGSPMQAIIVYNMREVDELVFVDISATPGNRPLDFELIDELADECFMPLTVGGGIRSIEDMRKVLAAGADKIVINSAALETPALIREGAARYGSQCIVVSIDVFRDENNDCMVYSQCGKQPAHRDPVEWAKEAEALGAGEILLTSIVRDGTMSGYDIPLTKSVCEAVTIPVIASGGAGNYAHMAEVLRDGGATAVAASSIFLFTEQTPLEAKMYLKGEGFNVRV